MKLYLIDKEDYIRHINDKIQLYAMLKGLAAEIDRVPANRGSKTLSKMATQFEELSDKMFGSWGIPVEYLSVKNERFLAELMENELLAPDEFGFPNADPHEQGCCDGHCGCDDCDACDDCEGCDGCEGCNGCEDCDDCDGCSGCDGCNDEPLTEEETANIVAVADLLKAVSTIVNFFHQI